MSESFREKVYSFVKQIPRGKVVTYKQVAVKIGQPKSCRAIGAILRANPNAPYVPCHRVVKSNGEIGGYFGQEKISQKILLLKKEGIKFIGKKIDLNNYLWKLK